MAHIKYVVTVRMHDDCDVDVKESCFCMATFSLYPPGLPAIYLKVHLIAYDDVTLLGG